MNVTVIIFQWFLGKNLSVTYDDITVSATPISEDSETQIYNISIKHHKAQDLQEKDAEYTNVQHVKVTDNTAYIVKLKCFFIGHLTVNFNNFSVNSTYCHGLD